METLPVFPCYVGETNELLPERFRPRGKSMRVQYSFGIMLMALSSCGPARETQEQNNNKKPPVSAAPSASAPTAPSHSAHAPSALTTNETQQAPKSSLPEPRGPIDPKSIEAAGQIVQHYGALIEEGRLDEAARLWGDPAAAAEFARQLRPGTHMEIGDLGETEGAAGSIYTTVPTIFYVDTFRKPAQVILRRVNDVPGSTEDQRRWHIERIEWSEAP